MTTEISVPKERPKDAAQRLYSDRFLAQLGERFDFDALGPETALELRRMARFYLFARREQNKADQTNTDQKEYRTLRKAALRFIALIKTAQEDSDIATDMYLLAARHRSSDPFGISDLPESGIEGRNDRHYRHLVGLANLLAAAARDKIDHLKLPSGPRKNEALEILAQSASYFWSHNLGRKFSIDYHQNSGLTEAFRFVQALLAPFGDNIGDQQIITAMRAAIKSRNAREKRLKPLI
jgi:hypothetical protein